MSRVSFVARIGLLFVAISALAQAPSSFQAVGNMSQLMIDVIFPTSNAIFYVERNEPKNDQDWNALKSNALTLAESGNLLLMDSRMRQGAWAADAKLLIDAGAAAYKAAQAKDLKAVLDLNDQLYKACVTCHEHYRPNYRRRN